MKIFAVTRADMDAPLQWYTIGDSCLTPRRRPVFLPDWDSDMRLLFSPAVCIDRLGKGIASRFASRYYSRAALGWTMRGEEQYSALAARCCPTDSATNFDGAAVADPMTDFATVAEMVACGVGIVRNGAHVADMRCSDLRERVDRIIEILSRRLTLKTGDIIYPIMPHDGIAVARGDEFTLVSPDGDTIHNFRVK